MMWALGARRKKEGLLSWWGWLCINLPESFNTKHADTPVYFEASPCNTFLAARCQNGSTAHGQNPQVNLSLESPSWNLKLVYITFSSMSRAWLGVLPPVRLPILALPEFTKAHRSAAPDPKGCSELTDGRTEGQPQIQAGIDVPAACSPAQHHMLPWAQEEQEGTRNIFTVRLWKNYALLAAKAATTRQAWNFLLTSCLGLSRSLPSSRAVLKLLEKSHMSLKQHQEQEHREGGGKWAFRTALWKLYMLCLQTPCTFCLSFGCVLFFPSSLFILQ